ncbi:NAD(P)/FAD-dependent oxidoreductase, partial [Klebsiella michiganensis]|uniref:NAD(P)/FAD-dependent oxidoreductase n=2 Tax=Klebsiella TaxID=570 RepID=UPI0013D536B0
MKAIVVGAGIVGTSIAYRLAQAGVSVTVLEAGRVGGGTSGVSYAWVNACEKISRRDYFELNFAGVKAHRALGEE